MEIERVKGKIMEGQPGFPRQYGPSRSDHQPGIPFFPQETARDFVLIFLLTALLFFLSAFVTPFLGPARSPQISELIVPDWYLLFSWGLLKVADVFPQFVIGDGTLLKTDFNAAFWGDLLSGIPVIFPWFGPRTGSPESPAHGFARIRPWELESCTRQPDGVVRLALTLASDPGTLSAWPNAFGLRVIFSIGRSR